MAKHLYLTDDKQKEKVLIVAVLLPNEKNQWAADIELNEMRELVSASGGEVVESIAINLSTPTAKMLLSKGKLQDIVNLLSVHEVDTVIFSTDLKGNQQRNLEDELKTKTIDRTQLILDIFAKHAKSNEGKMQVELAQLEYLLPRLVGHGIELSRLGGGIGTLGPGETKLEIDRRRIQQRIDRLKGGLKEVSSNRELKRKKRKDKGVPAISLVGYTNAGKSTLLNCLTDAKQLTRDGMFTTLDSVSRQLILPNNQKVVISDTVGFMHELPHKLIEAFKATLEEVNDADLLLHVVDISNPNYRNLFDAVEGVLNELKAIDKPTIVVFNKIDQLEDRQLIHHLEGNFDHCAFVSAKEGTDIDKLHEQIITMLSSLYIEINVDIPIKRMDLVNLAHEQGEVYSVKYYNDRINIRASIPSQIVGKFKN